MIKKIALLLVPILWLIMVFIKINISKNSNFDGYANMFNFMQAWKAQSPASCYFSGTNTFQNKGDKFVQYWQGLIDKNGNCYYNSFPPFGFQISYCWWKITGFNSLEKSFFWFNILLQTLLAFSAAFSVIIILKMMKVSNHELPALFAYVAILFTPLSFWFFTDYFFIENPALTLYGMFTFSMLFWWQKNNSAVRFYTACLILFLLFYAEAIGFFAGFTFLLLIFFEREKRFFCKENLIVVSVLIFALLLTLFQYSLIAGWQPMLKNFAVRFMGRSGFFGENRTENHLTFFSPEIYSYAWHSLKIGALGLLLLFLALCISTFIRVRSNELKPLGKFKKFWWVVALPVILHGFIFFNANALHNQLLVKIIFPLSVISAILMGIFSFEKKISRWLWLGFGSLLLGFLFYPILFAETSNDDKIVEASKKYLQFSSPEKSLILLCNHQQYYMAPCLFYHAQRNFFMLPDSSLIADAKQNLISDSSVIIKVDELWNVQWTKVIANK